MKRYEFIIRKTKEMEIDVCAENHFEAMLNLFQSAIKKDKRFFTEETNEEKDLYIKIKKIIDENGKENKKDYEDFLKENSFFIKPSYAEIVEKDKEKIENDLPKEYVEIVCEKCGNCIPIDEVIHQLES